MARLRPGPILKGRCALKTRTAVRIALGVLIIAFLLNMGAGSAKDISLPLSLIFLLLVVLTGVAFDIVGTAVAAATEPPINAVASRKIKGGAEALRLVRNAPQVANFCNDIVGDVCGTLSGALAGASASALADFFDLNVTLMFAITVAVVTTTTVTLKYISKSFAMSEAEPVILLAGKLIAYAKGLVPSFLRKKGESGRR